MRNVIVSDPWPYDPGRVWQSTPDPSHPNYFFNYEQANPNNPFFPKQPGSAPVDYTTNMPAGMAQGTYPGAGLGGLAWVAATDGVAFLATRGSAAEQAAISGSVSSATSPLQLGESAAINGVDYTRVGRWMSSDEFVLTQTQERVVQGAGGQTFVSVEGPADFGGAARRGSVYVEFDVPSASLLQGGKDNWFKMLGPDANPSQQWLLGRQGGTTLPEVKNIRIGDVK